MKSWIIIVASGVCLSPAAHGQDFDIRWYTIDGGGGHSSLGAIEVAGTIGQPDAGGPMTGGDFVLTAGFWVAGGEVTPSCAEDLDGSGDVGFDDLLRILNAWGACPQCPEDLDGNGAVDFDDLLRLLSAWGPCV